MTVAPARRFQQVLAPLIPQVNRWLAATPGSLSLAQGMVPWGPPPAVAAAVAQALAAAADDPQAAAALHRYGPMAGEPALLEAVALELVQRQGLDLEGSALLVTAGSNMAFHAVVQALLDPGDEVILPLPWYFNHAMAVQLAGGVPVGVAAGLSPDPDRLAAAITPRTRALVTVSPGNPSGVVIPPAVLARINQLCAHHGLVHISDEAYAAFVYGEQPHVSPGRAAASGAHTVSLFSLSKAHGMAGWRLGYAAVPQPLMGAITQVQDTVLIAPPRLTQLAGRVALEQGAAWYGPRVAALGQNRQQLLDALQSPAAQQAGLRLLAPPDGAFYALLAAPSPLEDTDLVRRLVLEHGVGTLPGSCFGLPARGAEVVLRLSYGLLSSATLATATERLIQGLQVLAMP